MAILHLDDTADFMAFSESEQSKNGSGGMVPLYAARVQDLEPDDVAMFKCGACGHTAELPPSMLLYGLGLEPTDKILDLERRLVCRLSPCCIDRPLGAASGRMKPGRGPSTLQDTPLAV
jgi:hypothetical protein